MRQVIALAWLVALMPAAAALAGERIACRVKHCHDGDTCTLACGVRPDVWTVRVRLYCIDAPELSQKPWGQASRDVLRGWLPQGSAVQLEVVDRDQYGRSVGVLWQGRFNVNLALVAGGWAVVYPKYCDRQDYYGAERGARDARRGVWRAPGAQQRPWEGRNGFSR